MRKPIQLFFPAPASILTPSSRAGVFDRPRLLVWDVQTGVAVSSIGNPTIKEIGFSGNRRIVNLLNNYFGGYSFCTYDAPKGTRLCDEGLVQWPNHQLGAHWLHEDTVRFATSSIAGEGCVVEIHEIQPASGSPLPLVESFPVPHHCGTFSLSPVSFHGSFVAETEVTVLDVRTSKLLLHTRVTRADLSSPGCSLPTGASLHAGHRDMMFVFGRTHPPVIYHGVTSDPGYHSESSCPHLPHPQS